MNRFLIKLMRGWRPLLSLPAQQALESLLRTVTYYLLPLGFGVASVVALVFWQDQHPAVGERKLAFKVVVEGSAPLTPAGARAALRQAQPVTEHVTRLSEAARWFSFNPGPGAAGDVIEFPSRHASQMDCWDAQSLRQIGTATRDGAAGALDRARAGFSLGSGPLPVEVVCRAMFAGPAHLTVLQWPAQAFSAAVENFNRRAGLLNGGMIILALFVLVIALLMRNTLYLVFFGWLILNLRVGALSAGWDFEWLGRSIPAAWLLTSRSVTMTLYGIATMVLYETLLRSELQARRRLWPMRTIQWLCLPVLASAVLLPYRIYLPLMWIIQLSFFSVLTFGLIRIIIDSRTRSASLLAASFAVAFSSDLSEVVAAALEMRGLLVVINSVTTALVSSMLAALAVAEQLHAQTTQRMRMQEKLEQSYAAVPVGMFTLDEAGVILSANPACQAMIGTGPIVPGRSGWDLYFGDGAWARLQALLQQDGHVELEVTPRAGAARYLVRATLAHGHVEGAMEDITEQSKAGEQLHFMANNDPLTRVLNRRGIVRAYEEVLATRGALALAYLDLDRFKLVNDVFGHASGDLVLKEVCARIARMLAPGQLLGRIGGDEFMLIMPGTGTTMAALCCCGIVESIGSAPFQIGEQAFKVQASIGVIEVTPGTGIREALASADQACREAKRRPDGLVVYGSAVASQERAAEAALIAHLTGAKAVDELFLLMQPIAALRGAAERLDVEMLLRRRAPDGSVTGAPALLAAADKCGAAALIDRWVLHTTIAWVNGNAHEAAMPRHVYVNLCAAALGDAGFVDDACALLAENSEAARRLCFDIGEQTLRQDPASVSRFAERIAPLGARIVLDDFGAGAIAWSALPALNLYALKIDPSLVAGVAAEPRHGAVVEAIVGLARCLGAQTVAEGIENLRDVAALAALGVDFVQGNALARPQEAQRLFDVQGPDGVLTESARNYLEAVRAKASLQASA